MLGSVSPHGKFATEEGLVVAQHSPCMFYVNFSWVMWCLVYPVQIKPEFPHGRDKSIYQNACEQFRVVVFSSFRVSVISEFRECTATSQNLSSKCGLAKTFITTYSNVCERNHKFVFGDFGISCFRDFSLS